MNRREEAVLEILYDQFSNRREYIYIYIYQDFDFSLFDVNNRVQRYLIIFVRLK